MKEQNKLGLYMNSFYWRKTVIKLLSLTNSVYNFSNNGSETENKRIKTNMLAREHVSMQGTLAREHLSTQGTLTREHVFSTQGTQFSRLIFWHTFLF